MPNWLTEVLKLLGLTTPFIYAAASYRFFHWLDQKASGPAKEAFSSWLEPKDYDKAAVAAAIVEVFDHVYTHPLLTLRAFRRSATITLVIAAIVLYEVGPPFVAIPGFMWILVCWYIIINVLTELRCAICYKASAEQYSYYAAYSNGAVARNRHRGCRDP